jgi:hypothetical protein
MQARYVIFLNASGFIFNIKERGYLDIVGNSNYGNLTVVSPYWTKDFL